MEIHPRVSISDPLFTQKKIILGSFPTWTLTSIDSDKNETIEEKEALRVKNNDQHFFYGSSTNSFWIWYKEFIDFNVSKGNIRSIQESLDQHRIGITDVILQCTRKERSSLDKHLINRKYNHCFFQIPKQGETLKILCTSKGVMNEMLLNKVFFKHYPTLELNTTKSSELESKMLNKIGGNLKRTAKPFCNLIEVDQGGIIECMALPSPGSPYRRLIDFGMKNQEPHEYLKLYLNEAFTWFKS